ncbi:polyketide synthase PksN [Kitasatospora sp. SolWspMP-SS2h]|uniref:acyl carrier protein n=1 Tax=Kitasatospora sp. SolWspMP-SS2h TaxID=1305729 RepID=UPI000DB94E44|nr:acyl carrier protein [Kitasatospora sp. SolWspMP-SS2h]RAJ39637.1 polyketide synthase PksN [Kitasatospora sp. SolWspMP-SS2h]
MSATTTARSTAAAASPATGGPAGRPVGLAGEPAGGPVGGPGSEAAGGADVRGWLCEQVAGRLGLGVEEVPCDRPLAGLGLDSVAALQLYVALEARYGLALDPAVCWDYPTVDLLHGHLAELLAELPADSGGVPA